MLRSLRIGLRNLLARNAAEQDLDDELEHYVAEATQAYLKAGMSPRDAERAARYHVGSRAAAKEEARSLGWDGHLDNLARSVRYALRTLRRNPGFTLMAVLTLALGIAVATTMFSVVNAVILRPLPYRDASSLVMIWTDDAKRDLHREASTSRTVADWQQANRSFSGIGYFTTHRIAPMTNDPNRGRGRSRNALVSGTLFSVLGTLPSQGRLINDADLANRDPVVVISYGFWQRWFADARDVIGRQFEVENIARSGPTLLTVIGVMPQGFSFPDQQTEMWTPATLYWRFDRENVEYFPDWARRWTAIARMRGGVLLADARADMERIGRQLTTDHPTSDPNFPGFATTVVPVFDTIVGRSLQSTLWILLGAVGLVLIIACVNVANLLLARGATRQQEFAVRRALGGGKAKLARQLVTESVVIALIAGALGTVVSLWATRALGVAAQTYVPRIGQIGVDWRVLFFALLISLVAGVAFGIIPALRLSGTDANAALRESNQSTGRAKSKRSRELLVALESGIAIVLLVGAGLLLRSLDRVRSVNPGFDPKHVLTMRLEFAAEPPPTAEERTQTSSLAQARATQRESSMDGLLTRLRAIPGVQAAGFIDDLYLQNPGNETITIPGRVDQATAGELSEGSVTPGMFEALRVPLRQGRYLTHEDAAQKIRALWSPVITDLPLEEKERRSVPEPVVVNEAFVQRFFPNEEALGKRFCIDPTNKTYWYEIVGVVGDVHRQGLERTAIAQYYGPYFPSPQGRADLLIRTSGDPLRFAESFRAEVTRMLPGVSIVDVSTAEVGLDAFSGLRRLQTLLLTVFAGLAVVLAAVGIFGLVHYAVAARTREIGVRVALGATPRNVLGMVLLQGLRAPVVGVIAGLAASLALTRVLTSLLFGVGATDPVTFAGVSAVLIGVSLAAGYSAGRAAVRINPLKALRVS